MKPVNLLPGDAPVVSVNAGKPNLGMIGGAAAGFVVIVAVVGYFAMARVDTVKSEARAAQDQAAQATSDTTAVRSRIQSLGQPAVDADRQLAQGAEQVLVAAYTERHDFVKLSRELRGIMGTNGWYVSVEAATSDGEDGSGPGVKVTGYMPSKELAASFDERADSQSSMANASIVGLSSERLINLGTKKPGIYWKFTMKADLVDTVSPSSSAVGGATAGSTTGTTVGGGSNTPTLSLDPRPPKPVAPKPVAAAEAAKSTAPAKPKNPFDVASAVAGRGGVA